MKRIAVIIATLLLSVSLEAQTTVFDCTFETSAERTLWSFQNNSQGSNAWMTGTTIAADGQYSMFVSYNGGTTCSYQTSKASSLYVYTTINITPGTYIYNYDCNVGGESGSDYLIALLIPISESIPTTYIGIWSLPESAIQLHSEANIFLTGGWVNKSGTIAVDTPGSYNLVFYWRNDASDGTTMSAAVDNIVITKLGETPVEPTSFDVTLSVNNLLFGTAIGGGTYNSGSTVTLVAAPHFGYAFGGWSDSNNENPRQLTVNRDTSLTALFFLSETLHSVDTVHDTIYHNLYHHDTVDVHDTLIDTIYINLYHTDTVERHDTVTVTYFRTDTVTITLVDTIEFNYYHTDTLVTVDTVRDTLVFDYYHTDTLYLHDTSIIDTVIHDTVHFVRYDTVTVEVVHRDTLIFNHYDTIDREVLVYDTLVFTDTVIRVDTVVRYDTVWQIDSVIIHDTVVVHDTIEVGIDGINLSDVKVFADGGRLVVENPEAQPVVIYNSDGRRFGSWRQQSHVEADVPSSGVYFVKVGDRYARTVVIIK